MSTNKSYLAPGEGETVFAVSSSPIKFGPGALREIGADAQALGMKRVALFVDSHVLASAPGDTALGALRAARLDVAVYDQRAASRTAILSRRRPSSRGKGTSTDSCRWAAAP